MSDEAPTKPTLETILQEMRAGFASVHQQFASVDQRLAVVESQLENMDIRFDRLEGLGEKTRSEVMYLRADFKEFKSQFKEPRT
ncbi:MAG: hypothetical protein WCF57_10850 [Pyrinomonadaceae bacterium]